MSVLSDCQENLVPLGHLGVKGEESEPFTAGITELRANVKLTLLFHMGGKKYKVFHCPHFRVSL